MKCSDNTVIVPVFAISRLRMGTDGSGITTLVTLMGCPLRCKYCLNKKCHDVIYEDDNKTPRKGIMLLTPHELYELVKIDNIYFQATGGGICFGGGEPALYPEFIDDFKKICRRKWRITIETSLSCSVDIIERLSQTVDNWIVDIKSTDPVVYESYRGKESMVMQNLNFLCELVPHDKVYIKVPHIPGYNDDVDLDADIKEIKTLFGLTQVYKVEYIKL